jgi:hypothetical protein
MLFSHLQWLLLWLPGIVVARISKCPSHDHGGCLSVMQCKHSAEPTMPRTNHYWSATCGATWASNMCSECQGLLVQDRPWLWCHKHVPRLPGSWRHLNFLCRTIGTIVASCPLDVWLLEESVVQPWHKLAGCQGQHWQVLPGPFGWGVRTASRLGTCHTLRFVDQMPTISVCYWRAGGQDISVENLLFRQPSAEMHSNTFSSLIWIGTAVLLL